MATRAQIERLALRIEAVATRVAPRQLPVEWWTVEGNRAWQTNDPERVIDFAELEARPTTGVWRVVSRLVHADNGGSVACCQPGGACFAVHGSIGSNG